ncbi:lipopolysaccharide kinase InaA family protein [Streptomyces sp. NPDC006012]|uniref:lipopolysaccharide kinase InaA family protein n=1 Tax=Streptomyces sp. NPDC006012 TaxID=3364739 RepID=UPI0036C8F33E
MLDVEGTKSVSLPGQRVAQAPLIGRADAEALAGEPARWEQVTDRRGAAVWQVSGPRGLWALKVGTGEGAATVARETAVLQQTHSLVPGLSYGGRAKGGRGTGSAWLITPWLEGASTWARFESVRQQHDEDRASALAAAVDVCQAVGALHAAGWVHGDLQPHHTVHTSGAVRFIDCTWASGPVLAPSHTFLGGLLHLMSPELMHRIEAGVRPVVTEPSDEVYALAAGLWWAATGTWHRNYATAGVDPARFTAAVLRRLLLRNRIPCGTIPHWPALERVLLPVLEAPAGARPSAEQLAHWMASL